MSLRDIEVALLQQIQEFEIIDCHEHLAPESERLSEPVDVCNLFSHYTHLDLVTAGMSEANFEKMHDHDYPLDFRWGLLRPYLEEIRFGSYARAAFIAARELYGFDEITDDTYEALSTAMQERNEPGIYEWILRDRCNIRHSLTQCGSTETESEILLPVMRLGEYCNIASWDQVQKHAAAVNWKVATLDEYVGVLDVLMAQWKEEGAVGLKMVSQPYPETDRVTAVEAFENLRTGAVKTLPELDPLTTYLLERLLELAAKHELSVAVHAGMWGDFTKLDVKHMIPLFMAHPETTFDLYHLSFPSVHDAVICGKNFANVYLDLCWTHIMSPTLTKEGMREVLDFVPVNKVLGFGGDYMARAVDKVIGHLRMAQENIATVLAERVNDGLMTEDEALQIARKWLWDNAVEAYGLEV